MKTHLKLFKRFFTTLLLSILISVFPNPSAADREEKWFKDARNAFQQEQYKTGIEIVKPHAEQGDADAQFILGVIYAQGRGVPQDYDEGIKWVRKAADQGFAPAKRALESKSKK